MRSIHADQALLPDGWANGVTITVDANGRIGQVTQERDNTADHCVGVLMSAPVNAHSHAFQRAMAGLTEKRGPNPTDTFWTWRDLMFRFLDQLTPDHIETIAAFVQMEMLEAGYATNVEFHYLHHQPGGVPYQKLSELSERILAACNTTGIGLALLPVHYQYGGCEKQELGPGQKRFGNDLDRFMRLHEEASSSLSNTSEDNLIGVAPHSLRAVSREQLEELTQVFQSGPVHMHLAEQLSEVEEVKNSWGARPVEWTLDNLPVNERWCMIHCTQMMPYETCALANTGAVAGLCPITESNLGDGIFDGVNWFSHGGKIAIGSDSNIRISLSEEIRTLDYTQRLRDHSRAALAGEEKSAGRRIFDKMVSGGAQAANRKTGRIETGYWADLMALDKNHVDLTCRTGDMLLDCFCFAGDERMIRDVWSAGRHLVSEGQHIKRHSIVADYIKTMRELEDVI